MKKGFTLIELVMVIVILGIISMFGADLYSQIYKSYLHTRALNQLESRTQNAITLISNRLENRIYGSTIVREQDVVTGGDMTDFINISAAQARHDVLEWVGQSVETKDIASNKPGWSGFIDTGSVPDSATAPVGTNFNLTTQGSQLGTAAKNISEIITNLGADGSFVIIFSHLANDYDGVNIDTAYGYKGTNDNSDRIYVADASVAGDEILTITNYPSHTNNLGETVREFSDQYYLAHSAYAIYPTSVNRNFNTGDGVGANFNLTLAYNYRPWAGETYMQNSQKSVIAEDVFMFRFRDEGGAVAMKLCMRDNGRNFEPDVLDMIMCKSQVVY